jgi:hypothetical protein
LVDVLVVLGDHRDTAAANGFTRSSFVDLWAGGFSLILVRPIRRLPVGDSRRQGELGGRVGDELACDGDHLVAGSSLSGLPHTFGGPGKEAGNGGVLAGAREAVERQRDHAICRDDVQNEIGRVRGDRTVLADSQLLFV